MKTVLLLLANGIEPMEMSAFTDVLGWATLAGEEEIKFIDAGLRSEIVTTFGLKLSPNHLLKNINLNDFDALAIPGGFEFSGFYDEALSEEYLDVIRHFHAANKIIASVCVASLALGSAGILNQKQAAIYHQKGGKRKQQLENTGAIFTDHAVVCDSNIITSTGPGTATEVALKLLEKLTSKENADQIRIKMRIPMPHPQWYITPQVI